MDQAQLLDDLAAEYDELDAVVAELDPDDWDTPTPAAGFAIRDQIHHLAFSEELASLAASDPERFAARLRDLVADLDAVERHAAEEAGGQKPDEILAAWRDHRNATLIALRAMPADSRLLWVAGEMSLTSFATARLMETWAHGQDVFDALQRPRVPTDRLRHIAELGVRTRGFSYRNRGLEPPASDVRVELVAPSGATWTWGAEDATNRIAGPAVDFCLVVTQRRHVADTRLLASGAQAVEWLSIAQAFAGPPTGGRRPGQFEHTDR